MPVPIVDRKYLAHELMISSPPVWSPIKQLVFDITAPPGTKHLGELHFKRWFVDDLPDATPYDTHLQVISRESVYDYIQPSPDENIMAWHVNFADPDLFVAYGSELMAQDEIQAAEHPVLGALREALLEDSYPSITRTVEAGEPSPITIANVERRAIVMTDINAEEGRPRGLYGNQFSDATPDVIRNAVIPLDPTTMTNLVAIAAPYGGFKTYTEDEIENILRTAYTGFAAARSETLRLAGSDSRVRVHSGFWGCGAFGGNRLMMIMLQIFAAKLAEIDSLVIHTVDRTGTDSFDTANDLILGHLDESSEVFINWIWSLELQWGQSDGN